MKQDSWTAFSYADEVPGFWDEARSNNYKKGNTRTDCDARSDRLYAQMMEWLNGRTLPDGTILELTRKGRELVTADGIRLSGDNMVTRFTGRIPGITDALEQKLGEDWETFQQGIIRSGWRIGAEILFPRHPNSLNGMRGFSWQIMDRFDLTLDCIRKFYDGLPSPLTWVLESDRAWFDHFLNFRGFVDFFLLNDWIDSSYQVIDQLGTGNVLPQTVKELEHWLFRMEELTDARCRRIEESVSSRLA